MATQRSPVRRLNRRFLSIARFDLAELNCDFWARFARLKLVTRTPRCCVLPGRTPLRELSLRNLQSLAAVSADDLATDFGDGAVKLLLVERALRFAIDRRATENRCQPPTSVAFEIYAHSNLFGASLAKSFGVGGRD
jgi:hypothetical protein